MIQPDAPETNSPIAIASPVTLSGIWQDLEVHTPVRGGTALWMHLLRMVMVAAVSSGFHMVLLYRFGAFFHKLRLVPLSILIEKVIFHWYHCIIPGSAQIGPGLWVPHPLGIVLNRRARLGKLVRLRQHVEVVHIKREDEGKSGLVGDRVQLNSGAILIRGAVVCEDSIVAARSIVTQYVPPGHVAIGTPAKLKPMRPEQLEMARSRDGEFNVEAYE